LTLVHVFFNVSDLLRGLESSFDCDPPPRGYLKLQTVFLKIELVTYYPSRIVKAAELHHLKPCIPVFHII